MVPSAERQSATAPAPVAALGALPAPVRVGDRLPPLALPPLTRSTLALYAGGSGDHIPLHIDTDFARSAGHRDVFMHGMLGVAYLVRMVTHWVPQEWLRAIDVRFVAITYPLEALTAEGAVSSIAPDESIGLGLTLRNASGEVKIAGHATVARPAGMT